jgi:hypothetical protein
MCLDPGGGPRLIRLLLLCRVRFPDWLTAGMYFVGATLPVPLGARNPVLPRGGISLHRPGAGRVGRLHYSHFCHRRHRGCRGAMAGLTCERRIDVDEIHLAGEVGQQRGQDVFLAAQEKAVMSTFLHEWLVWFSCLPVRLEVARAASQSTSLAAYFYHRSSCGPRACSRRRPSLHLPFT